MSRLLHGRALCAGRPAAAMSAAIAALVMIGWGCATTGGDAPPTDPTDQPTDAGLGPPDPKIEGTVPGTPQPSDQGGTPPGPGGTPQPPPGGTPAVPQPQGGHAP